MLNLAQLLRVPNVDSGLRFEISPDGKRLVFAWNKTGRWELYEKGLGTPDAPKLVLQKQEAQFSPRYSPDGEYLAYALDRDGSESFHIILQDLKNNSTTDLTPSFDYAQQPNFAFSPDGKSIALLSDEPGQFSLFILYLKTLEKNILLDLHRPIWDVAWSPNGDYIAVEAESSGTDRTIYIIDLKTKDAFQLTYDNKSLNAEHPAWSPDSKQLAFSGENGEWHDIGLFSVGSKEISWVHHSIGDDAQPAWSRDGKRIGWVHSTGAVTSFQLRERSGEIKEYQVGRGVHAFPQFAGNSVVILYEDPRHPPDLWIISVEDGSLEQLTNSLPDDLLETEFIQPREVWYTGNDGAQVPALLYRAENSTKAVINIHGGPNWLFQLMWYPIMSYMASRGWTVLAPNYRGSTGYGRTWRDASRFDYGGVDNDDCAAGAKYLLDTGLAQENKIGVTGRSHGGYLTMTCMTTRPDLWAVGSAVVPFLNWLKSHYESREDLQHWNLENMGDPEENRELWIARSPYFFLDKLNAPVQLICGANDPRCPASESLDARDKLIEYGKEVELLLYEGEGHAFLNTDNIIDAEVKRVEFMAKILDKSNGRAT